MRRVLGRLRIEPRLLYRVTPLWGGVFASLAAAALLYLYAATILGTQRELFFDNLTQWVPPPRSPDIIVVDVDREAYEANGGSWNRAATADLISRLAAAAPKMLAVDFVFSSACDPASSANAALAAAIGKVPR